MRKGSKLSRLRLLCDEGSAIPIHFEAELRPLRAAIAAATHWAETYRAQLVALGLYREDSDADAAEGAEAEGEEDLAENGAHCGDRKRKAPPSEAAKASAASGASVPMPVAVVAVAGVADELRAEVSYGDLSDMVTSAAQLVADFDLTR